LLLKNTAIDKQRRQEPDRGLPVPGGKRRRKMRRKTIMMVALTALLVALVAIPAVAVNKVCGPNANPCNGTDDNDYLAERVGRLSDRIYGYDGNDVLDLNNYRNEQDKGFAGRGRDKVYTNDTDNRDLASGGKGFDVCYVDEGDSTRSCERVHTF